MSMDMYLLRTPVAAVDGVPAGPELAALVPWFTDDRFGPALEAGLLVLLEGTADLVDTLLSLGAGRAAGLNPTSWDDDEMVGLIDAGQVVKTVEALGGAQVEEWSTRYEAQLTELRPTYDEQWAADVRRGAAETVRLFRTAAAAGEAVVMRLST